MRVRRTPKQAFSLKFRDGLIAVMCERLEIGHVELHPEPVGVTPVAPDYPDVTMSDDDHEDPRHDTPVVWYPCCAPVKTKKKQIFSPSCS